MRSINWQWRTNITITVRSDGIIVAKNFLHNLITTAGLSLARDSVLGDKNLEITEVAIGSGNTAPAVGDTSLDSEELRVDIIRKETIGDDTSLITAYIAPHQANTFTIEEVGWFGDVNGTVLMSRVLFNHSKTELESIQIDRQDSFAEGP